jgi:hypothetical protein
VSLAFRYGNCSISFPTQDNVVTDWPQKKNQFPGLKLPDILANAGVILENYPHTVPFPGTKPTTKVNSKGINNLSKQELKD